MSTLVWKKRNNFFLFWNFHILFICRKFQFGNITGSIGDYVLISNADAAEPDTEAGCDAARILSLYEDRTNSNDPFRAKVQWYSWPSNLPNWCFNNMDTIKFLEKEVIHYHHYKKSWFRLLLLCSRFSTGYNI